ncbi:Ctr copper transporter [Mycena rebaudengoi]|nr:Ctr copper transporter [Mycena rebaudengoi]
MAHAHDHSGHEMPMARCSMNMLWCVNTQIIDTCIVFKSWHVRSNRAFVYSCLAIVLLGVFYEYLRAVQKALDVRIARSLSASSAAAAKGKSRSRSRSSGAPAAGSDESDADATEDAALLTGRRVFKVTSTGTPVPFLLRALRATLYGSTVFLSFFLMLVFMTYNAYLIAATVLGAALGHFIFGGTIAADALLNGESKGMACH